MRHFDRDSGLMFLRPLGEPLLLTHLSPSRSQEVVDACATSHEESATGVSSRTRHTISVCLSVSLSLPCARALSLSRLPPLSFSLPLSLSRTQDVSPPTPARRPRPSSPFQELVDARTAHTEAMPGVSSRRRRVSIRNNCTVLNALSPFVRRSL